MEVGFSAAEKLKRPSSLAVTASALPGALMAAAYRNPLLQGHWRWSAGDFSAGIGEKLPSEEESRGRDGQIWKRELGDQSERAEERAASRTKNVVSATGDHGDVAARRSAGRKGYPGTGKSGVVPANQAARTTATGNRAPDSQRKAWQVLMANGGPSLARGVRGLLRRNTVLGTGQKLAAMTEYGRLAGSAWKADSRKDKPWFASTGAMAAGVLGARSYGTRRASRQGAPGRDKIRTLGKEERIRTAWRDGLFTSLRQPDLSTQHRVYEQGKGGNNSFPLLARGTVSSGQLAVWHEALRMAGMLSDDFDMTSKEISKRSTLASMSKAVPKIGVGVTREWGFQAAGSLGVTGMEGYKLSPISGSGYAMIYGGPKESVLPGTKGFGGQNRDRSSLNLAKAYVSGIFGGNRTAERWAAAGTPGMRSTVLPAERSAAGPLDGWQWQEREFWSPRAQAQSATTQTVNQISGNHFHIQQAFDEDGMADALGRMLLAEIESSSSSAFYVPQAL